MGAAHFAGHAHPYRGRGRVIKRHARASRTQRLLAPQDINLFSDRLDDARERESTVRDFALLRDLTLSADEYNS
jgi:hypothetical protein